jgi:hypothetical protein
MISARAINEQHPNNPRETFQTIEGKPSPPKNARRVI